MTSVLLSLLATLGTLGAPVVPTELAHASSPDVHAAWAQDGGADAPESEKEAEGEEAPAFPEEPPIELASPEATAAFEEGIELFRRGEFSDAGKQFKIAKKKAAKPAKKRIGEYEKSIKEAKKLPRIEKSLAKSQWRKALGDLMKIEAALGKESPLEIYLAPLRTQVEAALYFPLANFEGKPPEPEARVKGRRPNSATANTKPEYVRDGEGSLQWRAGGGGANVGGMAGFTFGSLPLAAFDGSRVEEYRILDLWIYSTDDEFGKFTLYFGIEDDGPGQTFQGTNILKTRCFLHHITVTKEGWQRVRVDLLKELPKNHNLDWSDVTGVALMVIPPSKGKTIYIDSLRLERP